MSKYYNPSRTKNLYDPHSNKPFRLSRTKLDLFINCPRCFFWIAQLLGKHRAQHGDMTVTKKVLIKNINSTIMQHFA